MTVSHLEIQVSHIMTVEMLDPQQDLLDEEGGLLLCQPLPLSYEVEQFAPSQSGNIEMFYCGAAEMSELLTAL